MVTKQNNFDLIRLCAAMSVLLIHAAGYLGTEGWWVDVLHQLPGVPIFFFVSGYLIFPSYVRSPSMAEYAKKRALRIYPGLYVCFAVSLAAIFALGALSPAIAAQPGFWAWVVAQLSAAQFYNLEALRGYGTGVFNGSLWTISVELQFYVLTPIIAWLAGGRAWVLPAMAAVMVLPNLAFTATQNDGFASMLFMVSAAPWLYMFLAGAWLSTRPDIVSRLASAPWTIVLGCFVAVQVAAHLVGLPAGNNINPVSFAAVSWLVLKAAYTAPELAGKLLHHNDISYGAYIYHMPVINVLVFFGLSGWLWMGGAIAMTLSLAAASWLLVERPALSLKKRRYTGSIAAAA